MSKFKVGDRVKALTDGGYIGVAKVGDIGKVIDVCSHDVCGVLWSNDMQKRRDGKGWAFQDNEIELVEPSLYPKFKEGDWVKVTRSVANLDTKYVGKVYEVKRILAIGVVIDTGKFSAVMLNSQLELAEPPKPEPKYPIIEMLHGDKIVFNPPYTIVTCNLTTGPFKGQKLVGKAKCNPLDTYDKWTGFKIAHDRMAKAAPCLK